MFTKYQLKTLQKLGFHIYTYDRYQEALKFTDNRYRIIRNRSLVMFDTKESKDNKKFCVYLFSGRYLMYPDDKVHRVDTFKAALRYTR